MKRENTAIHEAGHFVAHFRLNIQQNLITIVPKEGIAGSVTAEGEKHVWDEDDAGPMVIAYLSGYATLKAAGYSEEESLDGTWDDFEHAENLIRDWALPGSLNDWKLKAVELMKESANIKAVKLLSDELLEHSSLSGEVADLLVELADGNISEEEYQRILLLREGAQRS